MQRGEKERKEVDSEEDEDVEAMEEEWERRKKRTTKIGGGSGREGGSGRQIEERRRGEADGVGGRESWRKNKLCAETVSVDGSYLEGLECCEVSLGPATGRRRAHCAPNCKSKKTIFRYRCHNYTGYPDTELSSIVSHAYDYL